MTEDQLEYIPDSTFQLSATKTCQEADDTLLRVWSRHCLPYLLKEQIHIIYLQSRNENCCYCYENYRQNMPETVNIIWNNGHEPGQFLWSGLLILLICGVSFTVRLCSVHHLLCPVNHLQWSGVGGGGLGGVLYGLLLYFKIAINDINKVYTQQTPTPLRKYILTRACVYPP